MGDFVMMNEIYEGGEQNKVGCWSFGRRATTVPLHPALSHPRAVPIATAAHNITKKPQPCFHENTVADAN